MCLRKFGLSGCRLKKRRESEEGWDVFEKGEAVGDEDSLEKVTETEEGIVNKTRGD